MPDIDTGQQGTGVVKIVSMNVDANHDGVMDFSLPARTRIRLHVLSAFGSMMTRTMAIMAAMMASLDRGSDGAGYTKVLTMSIQILLARPMIMCWQFMAAVTWWTFSRFA